MFTGIIEERGTVASVEQREDSIRINIRINNPDFLDDVSHGDSIAVDGVCLTVTEHNAHNFSADVMDVTCRYTTLGNIAENQGVNLEKAMSGLQRFGGHIVQGHSDGTATLRARTPGKEWEVFRFVVDNPDLWSYLVKKGSVSLNGTSLTVSEISENSDDPWFEVSLIPTTLQETNLSNLMPGDQVNIETDILAKYIAKMLKRDTQ